MAKKQLVRSRFVFECLHYEDTPLESIYEAIQESYDGMAVGSQTAHEIEQVGRKKARRLLLEYGNDGEFFDGNESASGLRG